MKNRLFRQILSLLLAVSLLLCPAYAEPAAVEAKGHITAGNAFENPLVILVALDGEKTIAKVERNLHEIGEYEYFYSAQVEPGWYNLIISGVCSGCPTVNTHLIYVDESAGEVTVHPSRCTNEMFVLRKDGSPNLLVDGVYAYSTAVCPDGYDIFSLSVTAQPQAEGADAQAIRKEAGELDLDFYTIEMKRQNAEGLFPIDKTQEEGLLTLYFDYDPASMGTVGVWRAKDGKAEALPQLDALTQEQEGFFLGEDYLALRIGTMAAYAIGSKAQIPSTGAPLGAISALIGICHALPAGLRG